MKNAFGFSDIQTRSNVHSLVTDTYNMTFRSHIIWLGSCDPNRGLGVSFHGRVRESQGNLLD